ncbi:MAG: DNA polymerase III subunit epsilon [Alphaproteobacteria bacterium]|nr:DNA polymerase III subunit epsilon [Alphaproteobacteria bacterium]
MRQVVLDTETTGLSPSDGHRIVEVGCLELINHIPSGERFHRYVNPERDIPEEVVRVHGLTLDFLSDHPVFADFVEEFLAFIGDAPLVIHNAEFDLAFLNAELKRLGFAALESERCIDTLMLARKKFPGAPASLDALCKRFGIDNSGREKHGALLDSELLAEVYLELLGGREPGLTLTSAGTKAAARVATTVKPQREARPHAPTEAELAAHAAFLARLKDPVWES